MSKSIVFPYRIALREGGAVETLPVVEAQFQDKDGDWLSLFLLVDSGGFISALPKTDAEGLGINAEKGESTYIGGIGGETIRGWKHNLRIKFGKEIIIAPFLFLENIYAPRILGRALFFERFTIIFEEGNKRTAFLGQGTKEAKSIKKIVDKV